MKILFMGTPDFAVPSLRALAESGDTVVGVVSQPDRPKGRGHKVQPTPVKLTAQEYGIPVFQPGTLKNNSFLDKLKELEPDIIIVAAYGQLLPGYVLDYPKYGCVNVHGSLLPKYRGAAPVQQCIINGDKITGITTMYMNRTLDTGDMILKAEVEIGDDETAGELFDRLAELGGELIVETLERIKSGTAPREKQDDSLSSYAPMLKKDTGHIDWSKSAADILNLIRGTNPWPLAYAEYMGETMKIYRAAYGTKTDTETPGRIIGITGKKLEVCCGDGNSILIDEIQFKGGKRMNVASYINGHTIEIGETLK